MRADFRQHGAQLIYGTIRLIERDDESFLAWAREPWVCTVMNLHVDHTEDRIAQGGRRLPPPDRPRDRATAAAISSPITAGRAGRRSRPAIRRWRSSSASSGATTRASLPERLVSPLPADVLQPGFETRTAVTLCTWNKLPPAHRALEPYSSAVSAHINVRAHWHGFCEMYPGLGEFSVRRTGDGSVHAVLGPEALRRQRRHDVQDYPLESSTRWRRSRSRSRRAASSA